MADYKVEPLSEGSFLVALSNRWISAEELGLDSRQVDYIYGYLIGSDVRATCMLTEYDYTDADYLEDFATYYVTSFPPYERYCKRLHFFREQFSSEEVESMLGGDDARGIDRLKANYAGFLVVRPLPEAVIGRTVLHRDVEDMGSRRYYPATRMYSPNLFGIEFSLRSLAFEEQDTAVAACATIALWMAFHKTNELFASALPRPAAITRAANKARSIGRTFPASAGLDGYQMGEAIRSIHLEPEFYSIEETTPFVSLVYAYVAAGLPVVLSVYVDGPNGGYHAITVVGYSYGDSVAAHPEAPVEGVKSRPGRRIDSLFVHDDNVGPFAELQIAPGFSIVKEDIDAPIALRYAPRKGVQPPALLPIDIFVPTCTEMRVTYFVMAAWLTRLMDFFLDYGAAFAQLGINVDRIEWDLRLSQVNDFKTGLRNHYWANPEARTLVTESLPRYLWVATMYFGEGPVVDLIADVTDTARSCPFLRTMWHHQGFKILFQGLLERDEVRDVWELQLRPRFYDFLKTGTATYCRDDSSSQTGS